MSNPAEPWAWLDADTRTPVTPGNVVFFSGINTFQAHPKATNDPAATVTYQWSCMPDYLCIALEPEGNQHPYDFVWDEFENTDFVMFVEATATQGDRTLQLMSLNYFRLINSCERGCRTAGP